MKEDPIANSLNLIPIEDAEFRGNTHTTPLSHQAEGDIEFARKNVLELIDHGQYSVARLAELADQSQSTEAYKALAALLKTALDGNKELINLHHDKQKLVYEKDPTTINNNLVLTTADVLKLIKGKNENF